MKKIMVFPGNQPCLEIIDNMGLNRDRQPDNSWGELRRTAMNLAKEQEQTPELKRILHEDIAYAYGHDSNKFTEKFNELLGL